MVLKKINPICNSSRNTILMDYRRTLFPSKIKTPRSLLEIIKPKAGRSTHSGRISMRHQKGGHKKFYRIIDFKRCENDNIEGTVKSIEYDPSRNAFISLISYCNGNFAFILSPEGIKIGDKIMSGNDKKISISVGNNLPLNLIPVNKYIHNLEMKPQKGGQLLRSAGAYGEIVGKEDDGKYVTVKLRSKEIRRFLGACRATIGKVGNSEANLIKLGKAGRNSWRGVRPTVRGSAMNPCDHPLGGGECRTGIGMPAPKDKWGNKSLGVKTRQKRKPSNKYIVHPRSYFKNK